MERLPAPRGRHTVFSVDRFGITTHPPGEVGPQRLGHRLISIVESPVSHRAAALSIPKEWRVSVIREDHQLPVLRPFTFVAHGLLLSPVQLAHIYVSSEETKIRHDRAMVLRRDRHA